MVSSLAPLLIRLQGILVSFVLHADSFTSLNSFYVCVEYHCTGWYRSAVCRNKNDISCIKTCSSIGVLLAAIFKYFLTSSEK